MSRAAAAAPAPSGTGARTRPGAWVAWGVALGAYVMAVFNRASLGVAGLLAQHRFHAGAAALATLGVVQLGVYAAMQVPVGVLLDRFGTRVMVAAGGLVMAAGQAALAVSHALPAAVAARVFVGCGDAMTFISVLRLLPVWFAPGAVPLVTQLTGIVGQLGQVVAAYPLVALLHRAGWSLSFLVAAAAGAGIAAVVAVVVRDAPPGFAVEPAGTTIADVRRNLVAAWREPGTRLGVWTHFSTQFSGNVFGLLWGYPFLVAGEGLSAGAASGLISLMVVVGMGVGPLLGRLVGRWPLRRSVLVLGIVGCTAAVWTAVLAWPGRAPLPLLVLLAVVLATGGPGSMIGFDYARTANPAERLGSATGIVNVGGFVASLLLILAIGVVLQLTHAAGPGTYRLSAFRAAFAVQYAVWAVGLLGVLRHRRVLRSRLPGGAGALDPLPRAVVRRLRGGR